MFEKILKIFFILGVLVILTVSTTLFHYCIEQTPPAWIFAKALIFLTLAAHLIIFPLIIIYCKNNLSLRQAFSEIKKGFFSFWLSACLVFFVYLGYFIFFILSAVVIYYKAIPPIFYIFVDLPLFINLLVTIGPISSVVSLALVTKYITAPYFVLLEKEKVFASLSRAEKTYSSRELMSTFFGILPIALAINAVIYFGGNFLFNTLNNFFLTNITIYLVCFLLFVLLALFLLLRYEKTSKKEIDSNHKTAEMAIIAKEGITVFVGLLGFCSLLICLLVGFNVAFRDNDFAKVDDSDLVFGSVEIKEEGNLHFFLIKDKDCSVADTYTLENIWEYDANYHQFIKNNPDQAEEFIEENEEAYRCFDEMTAMSHYSAPLDLKGLIFIDTVHLLVLNRANAFRAAYLFNQGETEKSLENTLGAVRLGYLFSTNQNGPTLIDVLMGGAIQTVAFDGLSFPIKETIDPESLKLYVKKLEEYEITPDAMRKGIRHEYMTISYALDHPEAVEDFGTEGWSEFTENEYLGKLITTSGFFNKPKKTKGIFADYYRHILQWEYSPEKVSGEDIIEFYVGDHPITYGFVDLFIKDNAFGRLNIWMRFMLTNLEEKIKTEKITNLRNRLIRTALAAMAYENETGNPPKNLKELVPEYISQIPEDPFIKNETLQYSSEERKIYSKQIEKIPERERGNYVIEF